MPKPETIASAIQTILTNFHDLEVEIAASPRAGTILLESGRAILRELSPMFQQDAVWKGALETLAPTTGPKVMDIKAGYPELAGV